MLKTPQNSRTADGVRILRIQELTCSDNVDFPNVASRVGHIDPMEASGKLVFCLF